MLVRECPSRSGRVRGGFTLMEMLVVVAIIVVLAGIGGAILLPKLDEAKEDIDLVQMKALTQQCVEYKMARDEFPPNLEELTRPKANGSAAYIEPQALVPKSMPSGHYSYDASGSHNNGVKPDIWLDGPHGQIGNWMLKVPR